MAGRDEPTREEVFAFIDAATGRGAREACQHFAAQGRPIDGAKVRQWMKRRRDGVTPAVTVARKSAGGALSAGAQTPLAASRARAERLAALGPEVRGELRRGAVELARFIGTGGETAEVNLATGEAVKIRDMRAVAHAANALKMIFEFAPGIAAFDQETGGETTDAGAEAAAVAAAMGVDPNAAPVLRVVGAKPASS